MPRLAANLNALTRKQLLEDGYHVQVVEHYDHHTRRRYDLFGVIDVLAIGHGETLAVQATSRKNGSSRRRKTLGSPTLEAMLRAGWRVELWLWDQPGGPRTAYRLKRESLDV